ncbi:MAG: neutral zinc metallopeptidase [Pseudomonadota bacterium]
MRLNPLDTSKVKVRGGDTRGGRGRRAGGVGCGALVIALIGAVAFGLDPADTLAVLSGGNTGSASSSQTALGENLTERQRCSTGPYAMEACEALQSLNETWEPEFRRARIAFEEPELVLYPPGPINTRGCGSTTSASGPFYCPADYGIYIETSFFDQLAQMSGTRGDFARLYVMAHEYGHHIQNLIGTSDQIRSLQQRNPQVGNQLNVRMELQADCYAGVWAGKNRDRLDPGDMEEGLRAAASVGDDLIARNSGRRINPDNFTHGTSQQRMDALRLGLETADESACDVYLDFR